MDVSKNKDFIILPSNDTEKEELSNMLNVFNRRMLNIQSHQESSIPLNFSIHNKTELVAGIRAYVYFLKQVLHIEILFIREEYRGKKLGSKLLQIVEEHAITHKATLSHLDTFSFQAKDFYLNTDMKYSES